MISSISELFLCSLSLLPSHRLPFWAGALPLFQCLASVSEWMFLCLNDAVLKSLPVFLNYSAFCNCLSCIPPACFCWIRTALFTWKPQICCPPLLCKTDCWSWSELLQGHYSQGSPWLSPPPSVLHSTLEVCSSHTVIPDVSPVVLPLHSLHGPPLAPLLCCGSSTLFPFSNVKLSLSGWLALWQMDFALLCQVECRFWTQIQLGPSRPAPVFWNMTSLYCFCSPNSKHLSFLFTSHAITSLKIRY